jgi:hypothetical protein
MGITAAKSLRQSRFQTRSIIETNAEAGVIGGNQGEQNEPVPPPSSGHLARRTGQTPLHL